MDSVIPYFLCVIEIVVFKGLLQTWGTPASSGLMTRSSLQLRLKMPQKHYTPIGGISNNSTRVDEVSVYNDASLRSVQRSHLNAILHRVCPEHGSSQVVDGKALWAIQIFDKNNKGQIFNIIVFSLCSSNSSMAEN